MKKVGLIVLQLLFVFSCATFARQTSEVRDPCELAKIPLTVPTGLSIPSDQKLKVVNHFLRFRPQAQGTLILQNTTEKPIYGITMLVNYEDEQGSPIFAIPYQADVEPRENIPTNIRTFFQGMFTKPVQPGEVFDLSGTNLLTPTIVPTKAEVSMINLRVRDGGFDTSIVGKFRTDPILEEVPAQDLQPLPASADDLPDVLVRLNLGARGNVTDASQASEAESRGQVPTSVMEEIRKWRFFPAIREGFGTPSELFLLLRFRRWSEPPIRECFIGQQNKYPSTFVIVTIKTGPKPGHWALFYDKYDVSGWNGLFLGQQRFQSTTWTIKDR